ncbi:5-formyltetrahydrofolate cyclo-ligase [Bacillaceae bacterium]
MDKRALRRAMLSLRNGMSLQERADASRRIVSRILASERYRESQVIFAFVPFGSEVDIRPLFAAAQAKGKTVLIPKALAGEKRLLLYHFAGWEKLLPGAYGILEPDEAVSRPADPRTVDYVIVPGVAFDRKGGRLGYGGGYYDRFFALLPKLPWRVGVCFAQQVVPCVPLDPHDVRVDELITEKAAYACEHRPTQA